MIKKGKMPLPNALSVKALSSTLLHVMNELLCRPHLLNPRTEFYKLGVWYSIVQLLPCFSSAYCNAFEGPLLSMNARQRNLQYSYKTIRIREKLKCEYNTNKSVFHVPVIAPPYFQCIAEERNGVRTKCSSMHWPAFPVHVTNSVSKQIQLPKRSLSCRLSQNGCLTLWSRVLLKKLIVGQLLKIYSILRNPKVHYRVHRS
jgi:hypothetical protein